MLKTSPEDFLDIKKFKMDKNLLFQDNFLFKKYSSLFVNLQKHTVSKNSFFGLTLESLLLLLYQDSRLAHSFNILGFSAILSASVFTKMCCKLLKYYSVLLFNNIVFISNEYFYKKILTIDSTPIEFSKLSIFSPGIKNYFRKKNNTNKSRTFFVRSFLFFSSSFLKKFTIKESILFLLDLSSFYVLSFCLFCVIKMFNIF